MALCENGGKENYFIVAVFVYAIGFGVWAVHSFFQPEFVWLPWINLIFALLVCVGIGFKLVCDIASKATRDYNELGQEDKKVIHEVGKKLGKAVFSLMKEKRGQIGEFCRKWDEAK